MIGVLIASHNELAQALLGTCDMVIGNHEHCHAVCLKEDIISFADELTKKLDELLVNYEEVIILTDLKGGTPYNQSLKYKFEKGKEKVYVVCGFNFPMVVDLILSSPHAESTSSLLNQVINSAKQGIELYQEEDLSKMDIF